MSRTAKPSRKPGFIGLGRSEDQDISRAVDEILATEWMTYLMRDSFTRPARQKKARRAAPRRRAR